MSEDEITQQIRRVRRRMAATRVVGALVVVGALASTRLPHGGPTVAVALGVLALLAIVGVGVPSMLRLRALHRLQAEAA